MLIYYNIAVFFLCIILPQHLSTLESPQLYHYYKRTKFNIAKKWSQKEHFAEEHRTREPFVTINTDHKNTNDYSEAEPALPTTNTTSILEPSPISSDAINEHREEGAFCRRSFDGRGGYCILAYQCIHAIKEYRIHGTQIDICSYQKNIPIICCPLADKQVENQRISAKKCQEYHNALKSVKIEEGRNFSEKVCVPSVPMIVGGEVIEYSEYPHMAALGWTQDNDGDDDGDTIQWGCGGTLISDFFVLTAAHCASSNGIPPDMVRLGARNLNENTKEQQDIKILMIIQHPKYVSSLRYHDIALIKLMRRVEFTLTVQPACLWQLPDIGIHTAFAAGWGRTEYLGPTSDALRKVDLHLIDQNVCRSLYPKERRLPHGIIDEQFCAGLLEGGKDTCQGDSGGPLHAILPEYNCVKFVIGITSFGKFCGAPNAPGVYTKIYAYLDWIERLVFRM